jgi:DNA-binding CsgD family transcriptional regulator/alkylated DNA nucleotide flippase Atl1
MASSLGLLKQVQAGGGAAILVRGEGGLGKSRLVAEILNRAEAMGCTVMLGRTGDFDRGIPYAAFRDAISSIRPPSEDPDTLALIDALSVSVDLDAQSDSMPDSESGRPRQRVYETSIDMLRGLAEHHPTVLVLEDLHIADADSLALVSLLVRHLVATRVMVVATERRQSGQTVGELSSLIDQLVTEGRGLTLELQPLDEAEVRALVHALVGASPDRRTVDVVFGQSAGNPLLVQVALLSLQETGALVIDSSGCRLVGDEHLVSPSRRATLLHRVFRGTPSESRAVSRVMLDDLGGVDELLDLNHNQTGDAFDALVASGLVIESSDGSYQFSHPIVRDTIYGDIGPAERRRIHAAIAARLSQTRRRDSARDLLELATHLAESAPPGDTKSIDIIIQAARAVGTRAPRVAADWYARALELLPHSGGLRADLLARRARVLWMAARPTEAAIAGRMALDLVEPGSDVRTMTASVVANALYSTGAVGEALAFVEDEISVSGQRCPLPALRANLLGQAGRIQEAGEAFDAALGCLDGSAGAQAIALGHLIHLAHLRGDLGTVERLLGQLESLVPDASTATVLAIREFSAFLRVGRGFISDAEADLAAVGELLETSDFLDLGGQVVATKVRNRWLLGRWDEALDLARSAGLQLQQAEMTITLPYLRAVETAILVNRGRVDQARHAIDLASPGMALRPMAAWARALVHRALGQMDEAIRALTTGVEMLDNGVLIFADLVLSLLAEFSVEIGDRSQAAEASRKLSDLADVSRHPWSRHLSLRTTALVEGDLGAAEQALAVAEEEGIVFGAGRSRLLLGDHPTDGEDHLLEAHTIFGALEADPWQRTAAKALRDRGMTVPRKPTKKGTLLSEAEARIARLVQEGLTNRQIASTLHYSPKTIEVYLSRVYAKTGCASRFELARALDSGSIHID